ncbi:MAG TPA: DUF5686 family protein [Bacteroidia bacterium]|nr:DUF5686 family protein [Bacteroidia bacterium]
MQAQETKISGKIYDAKTREPLPFISIALQGTTIGTTSDVDGKYSITTNVHADTIQVSYIGYNTFSQKIVNHKTQIINVFLQPSELALPEVTIRPGENPAHKILRKVIAHKPENDPENIDAYQYEVYNKLEFDLNNLSEKFKNRKVFKPIKFVFDNIDSSNVKEKPYLPMFISESLSDVYYKKNPKYNQEIIKASKVSGMQDASIAQFTGDMYQTLNIYDNSILVEKTSCYSPISSNGLLYYKYYLIDSMLLNGHWCYQIQFKPKHKQEFAFSGNIWIADTTFAVARLEMTLNPQANINFITEYNLIQDYKDIDNIWMLSTDKRVVDYALKDNSMGVYGRKTTYYHNIVLHQPKPDDFYSHTNNLVLEKGAENRSLAYWKKNRPDSLSKEEKSIYQMVDSVKSLPIYHTWFDIISLIYGGYKTVGNIDIGPYGYLLSTNQIEGTRIRIGGRTSTNFSSWYELSGYGAYGFTDKKLKYEIGFKTFISHKPREIVGITYKDDYEILGNNDNIVSRDQWLTSLFTTSPLNNLTKVEEVHAYFDKEWFSGFGTIFNFSGRTMTPLGDFKYQFYNNNGQLITQSTIKSSEIKLETTYSKDQKYVDEDFVRIPMPNKYPVFQFDYMLGLKGVFNSNYQYNKFVLNISQRVNILPFGHIDYVVEGGKVFGNIPYPLMVLHPGNESYFYDPNKFVLMNYYEFASDQYFDAMVEEHFDGFFFNHIPFLRKLKWREVAEGKFLVGSVSSTDKNILIFPSTLHSLNKGPYYEAGFGIENIFKVLRIDAVWRLSYLNDPNISRFGIRGTLQFMF